MIIRTRLCIQPSASSWRMPASTNGKPVRPSRHASNRSLGRARRTSIAGQLGPQVVPRRVRAGATARRRRTRARPARCGTVAAAAAAACAARSASSVRGWISPYFRCADSREVAGQVRAGRGARRSPSSALVEELLPARRRGRPRRPAAASSPPGRARRAAPRCRRVRGPAQAGAARRRGAASRASRQARENGVKTWYGVPSPLRHRPGPTAYGVPVAHQRRRRAGAARRRPRSSRRRPYGPESALTWTLVGADLAARPGARTSRGSPCRTTSAPSSCVVAARAATAQPGAPRRRRPAPTAAGRGRTAAGPGRRPAARRREQRRVVVQPQVAAQPQDGVGHRP